MKMNQIKINGIYRHFKGDYYLLVDVAKHSETGEDYVVYRKLYEDCALWVRPLDMFLEEVDQEKYPEIKVINTAGPFAVGEGYEAGWESARKHGSDL